MRRSKYNVGANAEKRSYGGIVFDSIMEMKYYRDVLLPKAESGEIADYEIQKGYVLQPAFERDGKKIRPIIYVADFWYKTESGQEYVVDVKGYADPVALLKRKMFWKSYPDVVCQWLTYSKKYGGWLDYDELKKLRKRRKTNG